MELTEEQKKIVVNILSKADGEDMDEIVNNTGFGDYLLRSLILRASDDDIQYLLEEIKHLAKL